MKPGHAIALLLVVGLASPTQAGPLEARALWEAARSVPKSPWPPRVRALRAVVEAARPTDRLHARALAAIATTVRAAERPHAANAFEARAASLGPRRSRRRIDAELRLAKDLRHELDLASAERHLARIAEDGRHVAPRSAEQALALLAEDAYDRADGSALQRLHLRLEATRVRPHVRLEILGWLGLLDLETGDRRRAERRYRAARRVYEEAIRDDEGDAIRCSRLWLDFPLRRALAATSGG